jgi:hypothetical protein
LTTGLELLEALLETPADFLAAKTLLDELG